MKSDVHPDFIKLTRFKILGPHIDRNWYHQITLDNGLPYFPALLLLADAVYWSKPTPIINEVNGKLIRYERKTRDKFLLRTFTNYKIMYGLSKSQVEKARKKLVELNLIKLKEKKVKTESGKFTCVGYYTIPIIENIKKITLDDLSSTDDTPSSTEDPPSSTDALTNSTSNITTDIDLSKDKSMRPEGTQSQQDRNSEQDCSRNKILPKIKKNNSDSKSRKSKSKQSCSKKNNSCKSKSTIDNPYLKHKITISDLRNYNELKSHGITNHKVCTKAEADSLDKLHALFDSRCKVPFYPVHIPEEFVDYEWTMDDLIEIFEYHLEQAPKYNMKVTRSIGKFIFTEGFNGSKSYSPLLYWARKMMMTDDSLTEDGKKLAKVMLQNNLSDVQDLDSTVINRIARELNEAKKKYIFVDSTSGGMIYPAGIISVFTKYLKEKLNKLNFELVYITKKGFVNEFLHIAVKRNILRRKNGRRGVNG